MPCFGGITPFPKRLGGGRPRAKVILDSLNRARGTGVDTTWASTIYLENLVAARAIAAAWSTNQRLANVWDPRRFTGTILDRWEKILAITPLPTDSENTRRLRIVTLFALFGDLPARQVLIDALTAALGSVFLALEYISVANAMITVPDGTYPFGAVNTFSPWSSTVAHLLVKLQKPTGMSEGQFYVAAGLVGTTLDPLIPAWATFDWYRAPQTGAPINVVGGPSAAGFYLDERNLDNSVFDV